MKTEVSIVEEYIDVIEKRSVCVNKKRRECDKRIEYLLQQYKSIENDASILKSYLLKKNNLVSIIENKGNILHFNFNDILNILIEKGFVMPELVDDETSPKYNLSLTGKSALKINEVHSLIFSSLIMGNIFDDLQPFQMVSILSCFTNINVCEELKTYHPQSDDKKVVEVISQIHKMVDDYLGLECKYQLNTGADYTINYDIVNYVVQWCHCETEAECKFVIQLIKEEKDGENYYTRLLNIDRKKWIAEEHYRRVHYSAFTIRDSTFESLKQTPGKSYQLASDPYNYEIMSN